MPKAQPHFDVGALLREVHKQDVGLSVSTNAPDGFLRIVYDYMRAQPSLRCHIYRVPTSPQLFYITKDAAPAALALKEPVDAQAER